jgi:hypothetical protein
MAVALATDLGNPSAFALRFIATVFLLVTSVIQQRYCVEKCDYFHILGLYLRMDKWENKETK